MRPRPGQAALEFLMTYGWAFLVMIAVVAGIAAFDPLGVSPEVTSCMSSNAPPSCESQRVRASPTALEVPIANGGREAIGVDSVKVTALNGEDVNVSCDASDTTIGPGETGTVTCEDLNLTKGQVNNVEVSYEKYSAKVGSSYSRQGSIAVKAKPDSETLQREVSFSEPHSQAPPNLSQAHGSMSGNGTPSDPYIVVSDWQLAAIEHDLDENYVLGNNIDMSGTSQWDSGKGFESIASSYPRFSGSLDGRGHEIKGLTIDRPYEDRQGVFGETSGVIENIKIQGDITAGSKSAILTGQAAYGTIRNVTVSGSINGDDDLAGVVGLCQGLINNSVSQVTVVGDDAVGGLAGGTSDCTITRSRSHSRVEGGLYGDAGGLVGSFYQSTITRSYATGTVNSTRRGVGGLIGRVKDSTVKNTYATGKVHGLEDVGGLIGELEGSSMVKRSYSTGKPTSTEPNGSGGAIGKNSASVTEVYWDTNTSGRVASAGGTGLTTDEMQGASATTNMSGFDFSSVWTVSSNSYPELRWE